MTRKRLATIGERGNLTRLYLEVRSGVRRYVVEWGAKRKRETYPATPAGKAEAEAFFKAFGEEKRVKAAPLTTAGHWTAYERAAWPTLRVNTRRLYKDAWRQWELFYGADTIAEEFAASQADDFRAALEARGLATETVRGIIRCVRIVYGLAERRELIGRNKWHLYKFIVAKESRPKPRAEYRSDEFLRIWRALDPKNPGQWRAWVAIGLLGIYGNRQNEILNLQWPWIAGDAVVIPREFVKTGDEGSLKLFALTRQILDVAKGWAEMEGYAGPYVLFPGDTTSRTRQPHYSIQSLTDALHRAEKRSDVPTIKWRAGHGFRRGLVGDLADATGDITLALQAIGDSIGMAPRYRVKRRDKVDAAVQKRAERITAEDPR